MWTLPSDAWGDVISWLWQDRYAREARRRDRDRGCLLAGVDVGGKCTSLKRTRGRPSLDVPEIWKHGVADGYRVLLDTGCDGVPVYTLYDAHNKNMLAVKKNLVKKCLSCLPRVRRPHKSYEQFARTCRGKRCSQEFPRVRTFRISLVTSFSSDCGRVRGGRQAAAVCFRTLFRRVVHSISWRC